MADDRGFFDDELDDDETQESIRRPATPPAEGVRIIGAQEARAAYEEVEEVEEGTEGTEGTAAAPPPRPPGRRFPLPGDEDEPEARPQVGGHLLGEREGTPVVDDRPTGSVELPHWTEPPSGEVLSVGGREREEPSGSQARFRDSEMDWEESDVSDLGRDDAGVKPRQEPALDDDDAFAREVEERRRQVADARRAGSLPTPPPAAGQRFSSGVRRVGPEDSSPLPGRASGSSPSVPAGAPGRLPPGPVRGEAPGGRRRGEGLLEPGMPEPPTMGARQAERDMTTAILVGVSIGVAALVVFNLGRGPTAILVAAIATMASAEFYAALRARGYRPAAPAGLAATAGLVLASYDRGFEGFTLVVGLAVITTLVWFLIRAEDARPVVNIALTLLPVGYVGVLAAYGGLLLAFPNGIGLLLGVVLTVVAYDVCGYFVGSRIGTHRIAPSISPNKTSEGLVAGIVGAVLASLILVRAIHPWDAGSALWLGVIVGIVAPVGDLVESMLKRDMNLKDFGTLIPGHGGVLDRFDAILFSLPATFYLARVLELF